MRAREAALRLGVSEAELLAARRDIEVCRLVEPWEPLMAACLRLGRVMALTRNEYAVHEKTGRFDPFTTADGIGRHDGEGTFHSIIVNSVFSMTWTMSWIFSSPRKHLSGPGRGCLLEDSKPTMRPMPRT